MFKNRNVTIGRGLPGTNAGMSSSVNGDTYTVARHHDAVKNTPAMKTASNTPIGVLKAAVLTEAMSLVLSRGKTWIHCLENWRWK